MLRTALLLTACALSLPGAVKKEPFGRTPDGQAVEIYTLSNAAGTKARIMTYGATVVSFAGADGFDVLLGFDSLAGYLQEQPYMGAIVGRYGNRIAKGRFSLNGKSYSLATNNGANALHGGLRGFDKRVWKAAVKGEAVEFTYRSAAGEEGYPGQLDVTVTYTVTTANELRIDYLATASEDTVANLTNHAYFNLSGEPTILDHVVRIDADRFTPVDAGLIPTGELRAVAGTPFDFRKPTAVGARIDARDQQIQFGGGYDHNWALNGAVGTLRKVIEAYSPRSGRVLTVATTEPGVQFYTGNFLDGKLTGKGKRQYVRRAGFCFETQHYPDSPNRPNFPSTVVKKGVPLRSTTVWGLSRR
jgi:aldose 1-epimerase